jgi:hypothetical protein
MLKVLKTMCAVSLLLYSGICIAGEGKADQELVRTLMQKSGLNKQIEQIPLMMQAGMAQAEQNEPSRKLTQKEMDELNSMVAEAFDAKAMNASVQKHIQSNLAKNDIRAALAWLSSPLGEKITRLEEDASTPAAYTEMQAMADTLLKNTARAAQLRKLDGAVKATESGVRVALNIQISLLTAMSSVLPKDKRPSADEIKGQVNKNSEQVRSMVEQDTLLSFLYTYRTLTDAEIDQYIAFAESNSGRKYHAATSKGVSDAVVQASRTLGGMLGRSMNNAPQKTI